jgi:hypothetical protein
MPLISRQKQIPGGFKFFMPQLNWQSTPFASFDSIVQSIITVRKANPHVTAKMNWPTDVPSVETELDNFCSLMCAQMGWSSYIATAAPAPPPKWVPPSNPALSQANVQNAAAAIKKTWAGVKTLNEWLDSGEPAVEQAVADKRAATCVACPLNSSAPLTDWFTKPAAEALRRQLERVQDRNLATPDDAKLGTCTACYCPMRLKVWTPLKFIVPHLATDVIAALQGGNHCWILSEMATP